VLCEVCSYFCPADAIRVGFSDTEKNLLSRSEALPRLTSPVEVSPENCPHRCETVTDAAEHWCRQQRKQITNRDEECPKYCFHCIETCPRNVFREVDQHTDVEVRDCLRCGTCLTRCEHDSIQVHPLFAGRLLLDPDRCPGECEKCFQVCPVDLFERRDGRVTLVRDHCAYCGACINVCDHDALRLERKAVLLPDLPDSNRTRLWDRLRRSLLDGRLAPPRIPENARQKAAE
jgi:4Fe-4S ferredoxin